MSTILITGGAGFIGSHVAKKLIEEGQEVIIIDNFNQYYDPLLKEARLNTFLKDLNFKLYRIDITDFSELKKVFLENKFTKICHLAAQAGIRYSLKNPFLYEETNVRGMLNLLELAKDFGVKGFIYASSSSVYGGNKKIPFSEADRVDKPISLYAATKRSGELLAYTYHHLYKLPCTGLRYFTVYGPWGRPDMAYFKFTKAILDGRPIEVYNYGKMKRDFTYIDDIVSGTLAALESSFSYEIFNLGNSETVELEYFISVLEKSLGKLAQKKYLPLQAGDVPETYANISQAQEKLGYCPVTSIEEGIEKFVAWYKEYYKVN
ncbi:MAG: SDR family NAD(P)-dependent oxidoreductase [bacterium]